MRTYKTQAEVEKDIKNGELKVDDDIRLRCSISIDASITAWDIEARNITARNIIAGDINAWDITAWDITAQDIIAGDITAQDINAWDIDAEDIIARNITTRNIYYYAFCCVYYSIKCTSIEARREKSHPPICLEGKLIIKPKADNKKVRVRLSDNQIVEGEIIE